MRPPSIRTVPLLLGLLAGSALAETALVAKEKLTFRVLQALRSRLQAAPFGAKHCDLLRRGFLKDNQVSAEEAGLLKLFEAGPFDFTVTRTQPNGTELKPVHLKGTVPPDQLACIQALVPEEDLDEKELWWRGGTKTFGQFADWAYETEANEAEAIDFIRRKLEADGAEEFGSHPGNESRWRLTNDRLMQELGVRWGGCPYGDDAARARCASLLVRAAYQMEQHQAWKWALNHVIALEHQPAEFRSRDWPKTKPGPRKH